MKRILFAAFAALFIAGCGNGSGNAAVEESGTIEATDVVLSAQSAGKIIKLYKDEGDEVKKGDTLLVIDHELYDLQYKQAAAGVDIARAQLDLMVKGARTEDRKQAQELFNQADYNFKQAELDKKRMDDLYTGGSATKKQLDDAVTRYEVVRSQLAAAKENLAKVNNIARPEEITQARANLAKAEAAAGLLKKNIKDCIIISPINGVIVKRFVEEGETVSMMSSLFKAADLTKVEVVVYVPEKQLLNVKLGQKAEVTTDGNPNKVFEGKVIFISPEAEFTPKNIQTKEERTKQVFAVKVEIVNKESSLKTGLPADVKILL